MSTRKLTDSELIYALRTSAQGLFSAYQIEILEELIRRYLAERRPDDRGEKEAR
jgi:hypothetical protein